MKNVILSFAVIMITNVTMAQTIAGSVTGIIKDENSLSLPGATVKLKGVTDTTYSKAMASDINGVFTFTTVPAGEYRILASMLNSKDFVSPALTVDANKMHWDLGTIVLFSNNITLAGVNVVSKKPLIETKIDRVVVNVENSILASGNSALDILQRLPGVNVEDNGSINLVGKQGVVVMINDKPTYLSQAQLVSLLRATDGNSIKEIEIISNPSSKYDAAGTGGIINIKMKKNKDYGLNGAVNIGGGYGSYYKFNSGINLNYRSNKVNLFGSYYYSNNKRYQDYFIDRVNNVFDNPTYFRETSSAIARNISQNYTFGMDYNINDNNIIGFVYTGYAFSQNENVNTLTNIGNTAATADSSVKTVNQSKNNYTNNSINVNYRVNLDTLGKTLAVDADYSHYVGDQFTGYDNSFYYGDFNIFKNEEFSRNISPYTINIKSIKADYSNPITKRTKFELGIKASGVSTNNNLQFERLANNSWQMDNSLSNKFLYSEDINAAYVNFSTQMKSTTIQTGLRAEQTHSTGNSVTEDVVFKRSYINLFPSLFINQKLSPVYQLNFSYSRRIERPNYEDLNPFVYYLDQYTYGVGNPYLNPQYTNSFEMTFLSKTALNYSATFGYSSTKDAITEVVLPDTATKSLYQTNKNLATEKNYYVNLNSSIQLTPFWVTNNYLGVFYSQFNSPNVLGQSFSSGKTSFSIKSVNNFTINNSLSAELYGSYQSAAVYGIVQVKPRYDVDMGLRQSFGKDKNPSVKLSVSDIFNTSSRKISSLLTSSPYNVEYKNETRIVRLTFSYRFGSKKIKPSANRQGGAGDEKDRAGSNRQ